jgi:all-trans-retinol dehydrogenase (NAD+)
MSAMKNIKDKLILITGGASGIGQLMAFAFAEKQARVIIWDINESAMKAVENTASEKNLFIRGMLCDVSDRNAVYTQAKKLVSDFGPLDILVNNAGIVSKKGEDVIGPVFLGIPDESIIKTININALSLFWTCKAFLPSMLERNSGHVVTISSAAGIIGVKGLSDYCAGKFAAFGFDESLRMELRRMKSAVKTTVICPFFIDTGMFDGVKTRFPLVLPILKSKDAVKKIVKAVLKNKKRLIMPRFVYSVYLLRLLPPAIMDLTADFFGISHAMDDFRGRK